MLTKSKIYIVLDYVQRYVLWMIIGLGLEALCNLFLINQLTITLNDIFTWNVISLFIVFISKSVTREAIVVPISEKSKIKININFNNSKLASCLLGIFILSLILQLVSRHLFNIDPYTYVILLKSNVFIIISIILLVLVGISIYKYQYAKRY